MKPTKVFSCFAGSNGSKKAIAFMVDYIEISINVNVLFKKIEHCFHD